MVDAFRMHIMQTKELGTCPVRQIGGCSFFYMRISNVYIVIVVSSNANVACAFKFVVEVISFSLSFTFFCGCSFNLFQNRFQDLFFQ
jgi:AP-2 complex subunit mu-1